MNREAIAEAYEKVSEALEVLQEDLELDALDKPKDKTIHHIMDHLAWAESLLSDELKSNA